MVVDLLDVASDCEKELRERKRARQCYGRRSLIAALCLCGPRISEAVNADGGHFDSIPFLWRIPDSKTPAGVRVVEITAYAAREFRDHLAEKRRDGLPAGAGDPMWVTSKGRRLRPANVRRMLLETVRRTNEKRGSEGEMLLPAVTPHTLRRTFACFCFWAKRELPWVMEQIGHESSRMTVEVNAHAGRRRRIDTSLVWGLNALLG